MNELEMLKNFLDNRNTLIKKEYVSCVESNFSFGGWEVEIKSVFVGLGGFFNRCRLKFDGKTVFDTTKTRTIKKIQAMLEKEYDEEQKIVRVVERLKNKEGEK